MGQHISQRRAAGRLTVACVGDTLRRE